VSRHTVVVSDPGQEWLKLPLMLGGTAERLTGAAQEPMLYLAQDRLYVRLSAGAAALLDSLDGRTSTAQILDGLGEDADPATDIRRSRVLGVISGLRDLGAFSSEIGGNVPVRSRAWIRRFPRLRFTRGIEPLVAGPADAAVRHPRLTWLGLSLVAAVSIVSLILTATRLPGPEPVLWPVVIAIVLVEVAAHELGHAAACRCLGLGIREAGIMLWAWVVPLAYVDCTDVYRLPARRHRVLVALAGPFVDLVAIGSAAAVFLASANPEVRGTAFTLVFSMGVMLARNLAPLPPGDGYHALSAAIGELNLLGRSLGHLRAVVFAELRCLRHGRVRRVRAHERPGAAHRQTLHVVYGTTVVIYVIGLLALAPVEVQLFVHAL
jgi:putative peptide zinc metalloprotease protein